MMEILDLIPGSEAWLQTRAHYFTASEAPAMMEASKFQTRNDLLRQKATGQSKPVTSMQQALFQRGHYAEELARAELEQRIDDELYTAVAALDVEGLPLLASFDGINLTGTVVFEHKLYNQKLDEMIHTGDLTPHYYWQLEHQLLVSKAEKVIFVASDLKNDKPLIMMEYRSQPDRRHALIEGWHQFADDLANYQPEPVDQQPRNLTTPEPVVLPQITYSTNGLTISSDFDKYRAIADELLARAAKPLKTDDDFHERKLLCKAFGKAEIALQELQNKILNDGTNIVKFVNDLKTMEEQFRQARIAGNNAVKAEKVRRKTAIIDAAKADLNAAIQQARATIDNYPLPPIPCDFEGVTKQKSSLDVIKSKVTHELGRCKRIIKNHIQTAQQNLAVLSATPDHNALLPNPGEHIFLEPTVFQTLLNERAKALTETKTADIQTPRHVANSVEPTCTKHEPTITIARAEYDQLKQDTELLNALKAVGVERWAGYQKALTRLSKELTADHTEEDA